MAARRTASANSGVGVGVGVGVGSGEWWRRMCDVSRGGIANGIFGMQY